MKEISVILINYLVIFFINIILIIISYYFWDKKDTENYRDILKPTSKIILRLGLTVNFLPMFNIALTVVVLLFF